MKSNLNERIEILILKVLLYDEKYSRRILPFLKKEYFSDHTEKEIFTELKKYLTQYNTLPTKESLVISISNLELNTDAYNKCVNLIHDSLEEYDRPDEEWFLNETESFCQQKALMNSVYDCLEIMNGSDKSRGVGSMPDIMKEALTVSFNKDIGHSYMDDSELQYDYYHKKEDKIKFDLDYFNRITSGGSNRKAMYVVMAGTGVGKSMFLNHLACSYFFQGYNVFYGTFELPKNEVRRRMDANILNIPINKLSNIRKETYLGKIQELVPKNVGKIVIEEWPPTTASIQNVKNSLDELKLKKDFVPDVIILDYLNIIVSSRVKPSTSNMYSYLKHVAEEVRGLAVELNVPLWTATQTNRDGFNSSDVSLKNTSESFGIPATADLMFALISSDEMEKENTMLVKQLKNRYNDLNRHKKFKIGVDKERMKFFDTEQNAEDVSKDVMDKDDTPLYDKSTKSLLSNNSVNKFKKYNSIKFDDDDTDKNF